LEKLVGELRLLQRQMEQQLGAESADVLVLRYTIIQLMFAARPQSDATKQATIDFWHHMRGMGLLFPVRSQQPNVFCYHSPVKVDPWTKRCRRRYESGVSFLEEHVGVRVIVYFEEDFHTTEHAPEHMPPQHQQRQYQQSHQHQHQHRQSQQQQQQQRPQQLQAQDSWAAAMEQHMSSTKYSFL
jgi:ABC-type nickel/cobalt efflux system permease component RcnA